MKRVVFLMSSIAVLAGSPAQSAPDGVPARPRSIGRWYDHDPKAPQPGYEPWTAADAAGFLQLYPDAHLEVAFDDGKPPGFRKAHEMAVQVRMLKSILAQRSVDANGRICMSGDRPDVLTRMVDDTGPCNPRNGGGGCDWEGDMDGSHGEDETAVKVAGRVTAGTPTGLVDSQSGWQTDLYYRRLVVLRPGSASEERRRIVANDASSLTVDGSWRTPPRTGDPYEVRGSFDPAWVKQIPLKDHQAALQRYWPSQRNICGSSPCPQPAESLDPFAASSRRGWVPWVDRRAIEALRTSTTVPALYGSVYDGDKPYGWGVRPERWNDPYFRASSVVMDVANPAYRAWHIRYLLYQLEDHGVDPGESTCIVSAYKPGIHAHYDDKLNGVSGKACSEANSGNWVGPAQVCQDGSAIGGPLHPTPFAPGEYEAAINSYFRELTATLPANGYSNLRIITAEAPPYRDTTWSILADDVRRNPRIVGEQGGWVEPRLSALTSLPAPGATAPADSSAAEPAAASPPAAPDLSGTSSGATGPRSESGGYVSSSNGGSGGTINAPSSGD